MIELAKKPYRVFIICIVLLLLLTACSTEQAKPQASEGAQPAQSNMRVGFVASSRDANKDTVGRQSVVDQLGYNQVTDHVTNGNNVEDSVQQMVDDGSTVIFSLSEESKASLQSVAPNYPDVHFAQLRGDAALDNVSSFDVRLYQGWYLCGIAAGDVTKSQMIGYVAPESNSEVIRAINGFALGVKGMNTDAKVHVAWGAGYGKVTEAVAAVNQLIDLGCDVIVCHEPTREVLSIIRTNNRMVVAPPNDDKQKELDTFVAAPIYDYGSYYTSVIQAAEKGQPIPKDFWGGAGENTVKMPLLGDQISVEAKTKVQEQYDALAHGIMDVFQGPINNQYGLLTVPDGVILEGEDLKYMLWFVDNVVGEIPQG